MVATAPGMPHVRSSTRTPVNAPLMNDLPLQVVSCEPHRHPGSEQPAGTDVNTFLTMIVLGAGPDDPQLLTDQRDRAVEGDRGVRQLAGEVPQATGRLLEAGGV